ncbi:hypothetical protein ScPMuIL_004895 [Solemya velum]
MASRYILRRVLQSSRTGVLCRPLCTKLSQVTNLCQPGTSRMPFHKIQIKKFYSAQANFQVINIKDVEDFQKNVLDNDLPVIVDFHATWCGPCKMLGPRLESVVSSKEGKVVLAKIDVDDNSELAIEYGVQSVPTVMAVKKGEVQSVPTVMAVKKGEVQSVPTVMAVKKGEVQSVPTVMAVKKGEVTNKFIGVDDFVDKLID